ncbi:hypothetical protein OROMI_018756 [Orobanche minor]
MPYSSSSSLLAVLLCHLPASAFSGLFLFHRALCFGRFVATSCLVSLNSLSHIAVIPRWDKENNGHSDSKPDKSNALKLCKDQKKFVKQAIDSRYALATAHVSYIQSLRNIGTALRRYAEAEVLIETSLSTAATAEPDKTPSHASYPSPSPSHLCGASDTPISPQVARVSYMRYSAAPALTVRLNPNPRNVIGYSWDYFDPVDESFKFVGQNGLDRNMDDDDDYDNDDDRKEFDLNGNGGGDDDGDDGDEEPMTPKMKTPKNRNGKFVEDGVSSEVGPNTKVEVATFYSTIHFYNLSLTVASST